MYGRGSQCAPAGAIRSSHFACVYDRVSVRVSVRSSMHMNAATHVYAATYARSACICMPGLACIRAAGRGALVCLCTAGTGTMGSRRAGFPTPTTVPSGGMLVSLSPGVPFSLCLLFRWGVRSSLSLLFRLGVRSSLTLPFRLGVRSPLSLLFRLGVRSSLSPLVPTLTFLSQAMLLFLLILLSLLAQGCSSHSCLRGMLLPLLSQSKFLVSFPELVAVVTKASGYIDEKWRRWRTCSRRPSRTLRETLRTLNWPAELDVHTPGYSVQVMRPFGSIATTGEFVCFTVKDCPGV